MKALVDQLSAELSKKYVRYLETFMGDLWSDAGFVEFRCGFVGVGTTSFVVSC